MAEEVLAVLQGLECCLCLNLLEEPKLLSCTHSFCEKCLKELHESQENAKMLPCPLCRHVTELDNGDLSSLKTNIPLKSMVEDVKTTWKICTVCDPEAKSPAVHYCQECDECMCDARLKAHTKFKKNRSHEVVSVNDMKSGKVKIKQMCPKHAREERLWICTSCKVSICSVCCVDHTNSYHVVVNLEEFRKSLTTEIESLQKRGLEKIRFYEGLVEEEVAKIDTVISARKTDINKAFNETLLQLSKKKNALFDQCEEQKSKLIQKLRKTCEKETEAMLRITGLCNSLSSQAETSPEVESLVAYENLCRELQSVLHRDDPNESKLKEIRRQAEGIAFTPYTIEEKHNLGKLDLNDWALEKVAEFRNSGKDPVSMTSTKDRKMAVGYLNGGIEVFTIQGSQKTVLEYLAKWCISVLPDGRYIVRDDDERMLLYSSNWDDLPVNRFQMLAGNDFGGMEVDRHSNIYVGYHNAICIRVFKPEGGPPIREIPCYGFKPYLICAMNHSNMLVVCNGVAVRIIDQQGRVTAEVVEKGKEISARPAVLHDDSILIGWREDGHVTIDLYTNQLEYIRPVFDKVKFGGLYWGLRQFWSGEIALCDTRSFWVLRKS